MVNKSGPRTEPWGTPSWVILRYFYTYDYISAIVAVFGHYTVSGNGDYSGKCGQDFTGLVERHGVDDAVAPQKVLYTERSKKWYLGFNFATTSVNVHRF